MLLRGVNAVGYTSYADNVVNAFVKEARVAGVDIFRVFDSLNYIDNLKFGIDSVHRGGGVAEGTICYTGDVSDPTKKKVHALMDNELVCLPTARCRPSGSAHTRSLGTRCWPVHRAACV